MKILETSFPADFRQADIRQILSYVTAGKFCQLVCAPGVGKATILRLLAHNRNVIKFHLQEKEKSLRFIYLNLFELTDFNDAQIAEFLILALDEKPPRTNDSLVLTKLLTETVNKLAEAGQTVTFLFDHFDEYQNRLPRTFFQMLKSANALAKYKFAVVFATRRDLLGLVDEQIGRDFWHFFVGNTIYLKVYDQKAIDVLFAQTEKVFDKKLADNQKREIVNLTGGHAKLTKIIAEQVLSENIPLDKNLLLKNSQVKAALFELWLFLTAEEQHALYHISKKEIDIPEEVSENLTKLDILRKFSNSAIQQLTIPLMADFIKAVVTDTSAHKIAFNPTTKEIMKGESAISDLLSAQEYRLMKFLIENQGRIIERDELIEAVWPHTQVTEAVSDEAIDQTIFRLRKKIEDRPGNPKHLLTIKGRGIRFEP